MWLGFQVDELGQHMASVLEQAMVLNAAEKLHLIEVLWDSMAQNPESIPVPDWQLLELERRLESQRANPQAGESWEAVKQEILDGNEADELASEPQ